MYKPGGTIAEALKRIQTNAYVLPAIQREFVWKPEQIERLFDSLMQGYPFGTFLFWKLQPEMSGNFKFYDFVRQYHQRDRAHCPDLPPLHHQSVTAVLDGQQRLTALNIGLRGSMAMKQPNKWWTNPDAFPERALRLNVLAPQEADEDGVVYRFRFLSDDQATRDTEAYWFKVGDILKTEDVVDLSYMLVDAGFTGAAQKGAMKLLARLHRVVHIDPLIHYYEEETPNVERVLNIFIRLNSGGTVLSYSDLLLSIAVAQWMTLDARAEIHKLVDDLNRIGTGFAFNKDFVLKAGLMLADIASVGFKVENFTTGNMAVLESNWIAIRKALVKAVELVASFGFNGQTLRADSSLLPIAYYLYRRKAPDNYVTHTQFAGDRDAIRRWLIRSLLKASGIWGSGLDTLLTALRDVLRSNLQAFPVDELRQVMTARGKSLTFEPAEIEDLLHIEYGDKRLFALLSLLFPFIDLRNQFHMDHVFPISRFSTAKLRQAGYDDAKAATLSQRANQLSNLQLLEGPANVEKQASLPAEWLGRYKPDQQSRSDYLDRHMLGSLPSNLGEFDDFYDARKVALRRRLTDLLDVREELTPQMIS